MGAVECLGSAAVIGGGGGKGWGGGQVGCSKAGFLHCWSVGD